MPKRVLQVVIYLTVLGLLFFTGCKTSEEASQFTLAVTVGQGVNGTPVTGSYSYAQGDVVTYNYSLQAGYENLEVKLDGATVANSGVVTMNQNHTLTVTADERFNPSGDWEGMIYWTPDLALWVTFSGGYLSGTTSGEFTGSPGTGNGEYSISGNSITFDLIWGMGDIHFWGTIDDDNHMSGNWESYTGSNSGTWELTRL